MFIHSAWLLPFLSLFRMKINTRDQDWRWIMMQRFADATKPQQKNVQNLHQTCMRLQIHSTQNPNKIETKPKQCKVLKGFEVCRDHKSMKWMSNSWTTFIHNRLSNNTYNLTRVNTLYSHLKLYIPNSNSIELDLSMISFRLHGIKTLDENLYHK